MTITRIPEIPGATRSRIGWAISDTWVVTCRDLAHWRRQPGAVIANTLVFPVMIVLMFGCHGGSSPMPDSPPAGPTAAIFVMWSPGLWGRRRPVRRSTTPPGVLNAHGSASH